MKESLKAESFCCKGCSKKFKEELLRMGLTEQNGKCNIVCIGEKAIDTKADADIAFCPEDMMLSDISCKSAVSVGMGNKATLNFSSIGETNALLSVCREIDFFGEKIVQGDYRVEKRPFLSLYESMVVGFLEYFL